MAPTLVFTLCLLPYWNIEPCFTPSAQKCSDKINKKNQNTEFRWFEGNLLKYMLCFISTTWTKDNFLCWNLPEKTCMAWCVVSWSGVIVFKKSQWMYHCMKRMLLRHHRLTLASPSTALSEQKCIYQRLSPLWKTYLMVKRSSDIELDDVVWWLPPILTLRHWLIAQIWCVKVQDLRNVWQIWIHW